MKLSNAIKTLEKNGYIVSGNLGSYSAIKDTIIISFFENGLGSNFCSKFTFKSDSACAPTYGMTLKGAMA